MPTYAELKEELEAQIEESQKRVDLMDNLRSYGYAAKIVHPDGMQSQVDILETPPRAHESSEIIALMLKSKELSRVKKGLEYKPFLLDNRDSYSKFQSLLAGLPDEGKFHFDLLLRMSDHTHYTPVQIHAENGITRIFATDGVGDRIKPEYNNIPFVFELQKSADASANRYAHGQIQFSNVDCAIFGIQDLNSMSNLDVDELTNMLKLSEELGEEIGCAALSPKFIRNAQSFSTLEKNSMFHPFLKEYKLVYDESSPLQPKEIGFSSKDGILMLQADGHDCLVVESGKPPAQISSELYDKIVTSFHNKESKVNLSTADKIEIASYAAICGYAIPESVHKSLDTTLAQHVDGHANNIEIADHIEKTQNRAIDYKTHKYLLAALETLDGLYAEGGEGAVQGAIADCRGQAALNSAYVGLTEEQKTKVQGLYNRDQIKLALECDLSVEVLKESQCFSSYRLSKAAFNFIKKNYDAAVDNKKEAAMAALLSISGADTLEKLETVSKGRPRERAPIGSSTVIEEAGQANLENRVLNRSHSISISIRGIR